MCIHMNINNNLEVLLLVSTVLLTDDIANRDYARQEGLSAFSCKKIHSYFVYRMSHKSLNNFQIFFIFNHMKL